MSKPLPTQTTFTGTAPPWSLTLLDGNFTNVWGAINDIGTYSNTLVDSGAVNSLAAAVPAGLTFSLVTGIAVDVLVANTTTSSTVTLNVGSTGAKTVLRNDGAAPVVGSIVAAGIYRFVYDGTYYRIQNPTQPADAVLYKANATSRSNTTVLANDPDLQYAIPAAGSYSFRVVFFSGSGTSNGFVAQMAFSGTVTSSAYQQYGTYATVFHWPGYATLGSSNWSTTTSSSLDSAVFDGSFICSTAGTLAFQWAQQNSGAGPTVVAANSYMTVKTL